MGPFPLPRGTARRIASSTYPFAASAAPNPSLPPDTPQSKALENAHPVPCVLRLSIRSPRIHRPAPSQNTKSFAATPSPPVATTFNPGYRSASSPTPSSTSRSLATSRPSSRPSSARFGVTHPTRGSSCSRIARSPASLSRSAPELDTSTGSSTTGTPGHRSTKSATTPTFPFVASIPILIPTGAKSTSRVLRHRERTSADTALIALTPRVDCSVNAVTQLVPNHPCAANTCRSAVTPAPDPGSKPATESKIPPTTPPNQRAICVAPEKRNKSRTATQQPKRTEMPAIHANPGPLPPRSSTLTLTTVPLGLQPAASHSTAPPVDSAYPPLDNKGVHEANQKSKVSKFLITTVAIFGVTAAAFNLDAIAKVRTASPATSAVARVKRWFETGTASWYGRHFQGHRTATGEKYDMNSLTCAHRTLPLGSWVRVTNLTNHKSVFVRVNDRGPYGDNRIVDLSYAAAQAVGMDGTARVKLEPVGPSDPEIARALIAQVGMPSLPSGVLR